MAALSASSLYLAKNQTYRGQCQLIFDRRHAARLDQLIRTNTRRSPRDLFAAQNAVVRAVRPDHVNIESLGNVVPHLHWHIVPRYVGDARWGMPIWTTPLSAMPDHRLDARIARRSIAAIRARAVTTSDRSGGRMTTTWTAVRRGGMAEAGCTTAAAGAGRGGRHGQDAGRRLELVRATTRATPTAMANLYAEDALLDAAGRAGVDGRAAIGTFLGDDAGRRRSRRAWRSRTAP